MKIKYLKAKCFLSIGTTPLEIDFTQLGNIVVIEGINHDRRTGSSNGAGKSTCLEAIVFALYGKLLKKMSHKQIMHNKLKKGLEVEIIFEQEGREYRIVRKKSSESKSMSVQLWIDGDEWTQGSGPSETQLEIEKAVKLTYDAFVNISFFGQHNLHQFLSCEAAKKRQIVENLMALEKYNIYCQTANKKKKALELEIKMKVQEYEIAAKNLDAAKGRILQIQKQKDIWRMSRENELQTLIAKKSLKEEEIANTDPGKGILEYENAQKELPAIRDKLKKLEENRDLIVAKIDECKDKLESKKSEYHKLSTEIMTIDGNISRCRLSIQQTEKQVSSYADLKDGEKCPVCKGTVSKDNYHSVVTHLQEAIASFQKELTQLIESKEPLLAEIEKSKAVVVKLTEFSNQCSTKLMEIKSTIVKLENQKAMLENIKEPSLNLNEKLLAEQLENIKRLIEAKDTELAGGDPYQQIYVEAVNECDSQSKIVDDSKEEIKTKEAKLPYYDYWIKGFGDTGIRSMVIESLMPALNTRINYWLQFLIDNQIKLQFDSNFDETIENNPPDGDPFAYNGLSGGEHMRIDLAISQAFAYLMMLSFGTCPSLVALDEVVTYQDRPGVHCIYSMICELARDRQVLVITHDQDLLQMLEMCDSILIERRDGFSTAKLVQKN